MQRFLTSLLATAVVSLAGLSLTAQSVQLSDGRILLASVEEAGAEGLRVKRLDNGGLLDLRWDHLSVASATKWKRKFDLMGESQDEILERADEVIYLNNGTRQSVIGRITDATGDPLVVQVKGVPYRVPRRNLVGVQKIDVPAAQVYTKEEFYAVYLEKHAPGDDANKHMLLAEDLIKFRDYDRASDHLKKAEELDNATDKAKLVTLIDRLKRFKAAAKELGVLEQIQIARSRGTQKEFVKGVELVKKFETDFPNTKLKTEFDREKERFEKARERFYTQRVADLWRRNIRTVAEKQVNGDGFTLQAAKDFAENAMSKAIVAKLEKTLQLEPAEIESLWASRAKHSSGKRTENFNYGIGSWVLGDKEILKDTAVQKSLDKQGSTQKQPAGKDRDIERFAKLLRQAMERRRSATQAGTEKKQQTDEGWWQDASKQERVGWLRAYYAEYSGQMVVTYASVQQCISCYGEGTTPEVNGDGKPVRSKCFLCQGTKWLRSFKAY
tara:strand:+ start:52059 stop:53552 length:1494 start_codon:yes stop_codon:yes gene_type:complete